MGLADVNCSCLDLLVAQKFGGSMLTTLANDLRYRIIRMDNFQLEIRKL